MRRTVGVLVLVGSACGSASSSSVDAAISIDARAEAIDASVPDAAVLDANAPDASPPDATIVGPTCVDPIDCATTTATAGAAFTARALATGGSPPYRYLGTPPAGMAITPAGELVGAPEGAGSISVVALDANGCAGAFDWPLTVGGTTCPAAPFGGPDVFLTGTVGAAFTTRPYVFGPGSSAACGYQFTCGDGSCLARAGVCDGTPDCPGGEDELACPFAFAVSGELPPGVAFVTDHLEGTPTLAGDWTFAVSMLDGNGCATTNVYAMHVNPSARCDVAITATSLPYGVAGASYFSLDGFFPLGGSGTSPFVFAATGVPPGLTVHPDGTVLGVPSVTGTYDLLVSVTDTTGCSSTSHVAMNVLAGSCPVITVGPAPAGPSIVSAKQTLTGSFTASGGTAPYSFSTFEAPYGLTMASDGTLGGAPLETGARTFLVLATDADGCEGALAYPMIVQPATCPAITVAPALDACNLVACNAGTCGASPLGDGTLVANDIATDCAATTCQGGVPTRTFVASETCGPATTCVAVDTCSGQTGASCDVDGGPSFLAAQTSTFCDSGLCRDGVCCTTSCDGTCMTCEGTGVCHPQVGLDPDTCTGDQICDTTSTCKQQIGAPCAVTGDCVAGNCVDSWVDADGDGWGDAAQPAGLRCITDQHVGFGYTDQTADCCDSDANAHPGEDLYGMVAGFSWLPDACGDYDRNCDATLEYETPNGVPTCTPGGGLTFTSYFPAFTDCGQYGTVENHDCDDYCNCTDSVSGQAFQECR